jgi:uncharacterized protein (TIGR02145 family)
MKRNFKFCISLGLLFLTLWKPGYSQLTVTPGNTITMTPQQFVETYLVGAGVTVSNARFNGSSDPINIIQSVGGSIENQQIGHFTTAGQTTQEIVFTGGVILSSGKVVSAIAPPNFASTDTYGPGGDPDLALIAGVTSANVKNQAILEFDFVPQTDMMNFRYEFASEEFDTYCSGYNDAFGFFLSGPGITGGMGYTNDAVNIAILPSSSLPVTISNVCANKPEYSWWNVPEKDLSYNRFTFVFTASYAVTCLQTYHIKLAICDVTDGIYDSGVFLEQNSFSSQAIQVNTSFSNPNGGQNAIEGCSDAILIFSIANAQSSPYVIDLSIDPSGTATQADFTPNPLPVSVTIPTGSLQSTPLVIHAIQDGLPEGQESLIINASHTVCGLTSTATTTILIKDNPPLIVNIDQPPPGSLFCDNAAYNFSATVSGGYPAYSYLWTGGSTTNPGSVVVTAASPSITLRVNDVCQDTSYANLNLTVTTLPPDPGPITGAATLCIPQSSVPYHVDPVTGATGYNWRGPVGATAPSPPSPNDATLDFSASAVSGNVQVAAINACGQGNFVSLPVTVLPRPAPTIQSSVTSTCLGIPVTYTTESGMSNYGWTYPSSASTLVSGGGSSDNSMTLNWTSAGNYSISVNYSSANGCQAVIPVPLSVTVSGLPTPAITGPQSVCQGTTGVSYSTDPGMNNYSWTVPPGNTITVSGSSCSVDWLTAGSQWIKVVYQDPVTGCSSSASNPGLSVIVNPLPVPLISGPSSGCQNISLGPFTTAAGKSNYSWNTDGGTLIPGSGPHEIFISWTNSGVKQVSVNWTDANNCSGTSAAFQVTVNPTPVVAFTAPPSAYCTNTPPFILGFGSPPGGTYSGNGVANISGTWYFNPSLASLGPNTITYLFTSTEGCQAQATGSLTVNPVPDVLFNPAHASLKWCSGETAVVTLSSSVSGSAFSWTASANPATITPSSIPGGTGNISQAFINSGSMRETVSFQVTASASGCISPVYPYAIQINPVASLSANPANQSVCSGGTSSAVTISLTPATGSILSWNYVSSSGVTPSSGSGTANPVPPMTVNSNSNTQDTLTFNAMASYDNCPGNSQQFLILVNPLPAVTINGPVPAVACQGSSSSFNVPPDPSSAFTWSVNPAATGNLTTPQGQTGASFSWTNPANNVIVSVAGLTSFGCSASSQVLLDVHPSPQVSFTGCFDPVTIPTAQPFKLKGGIPKGASGLYSGEGVSFSAGEYWFNPSLITGALPKTVNLNYSYTNTYGCASSNTSTIQVVNAPAFQCENPMQPLRDVRTSPMKQYNTFWRGNRCWMVQNLDYGSETASTQAQTDNCQVQKFCPPSDPGCSLNGGFYQWDEMMQYNILAGSQGICPPGWHVPSLSEWQLLLDDPQFQGQALAGGYLKDIPFSATLEGVDYQNSLWSLVQGASVSAGFYWTSTPSAGGRYWARAMNSFAPSVGLYSSLRNNAFQLRCVKD